MTGLQVLRGRALPGTFLKSAAVFGALDLSWTACHTYGLQELNRAVMLLDSMKPKPGKLWERTDGWPTVDDATASGALAGTFLAFSRRVLPGINGWPRWGGLVTVGMAVGYQVGQLLPPWVPEETKAKSRTDLLGARLREYQRLLVYARNNKGYFSVIGRMTLAYETSDVISLSRFWDYLSNPIFASQTYSERPSSQEPYSRYELDPWFLPQTANDPDFPYLEAYADFFTTKNPVHLRFWLVKLHFARAKADADLQYMHQCLVELHAQFAAHTEESRERDILRRAIMRLSILTSNFTQISAQLRFHIASASERYKAVGPGKNASKQPHEVSAAAASAAADAAAPLFNLLAFPYPTPTHPARIDPLHAPTSALSLIFNCWRSEQHYLPKADTYVGSFSNLDAPDGMSVNEWQKTWEMGRLMQESVQREGEAMEVLVRWFENRVDEAMERRLGTTYYIDGKGGASASRASQ